ncbi:hypothetical protein FOA52_004001 [Chlamydomonas sp. UWO 241]|nr:hypothetical protein FOA52_004001 [Chlamydomonas sp. UWO 241]
MYSDVASVVNTFVSACTDGFEGNSTGLRPLRILTPQQGETDVRRVALDFQEQTGYKVIVEVIDHLDIVRELSFTDKTSPLTYNGWIIPGSAVSELILNTKLVAPVDAFIVHDSKIQWSDVTDEQETRMEADREPQVLKQTINNASYTPAGAMKHLKEMKASGVAFYWKMLDVRQSEKSDYTVLVCTECAAELKPSNYSRAAGDHFDASTKTCKSANKKKRELAEAIAGADIAGTSRAGNSMGAGGSSTQAKGPSFFSSAKQQAAYNLSLAHFFYKNNVAERLIEDPDLKHALALLGVVPPSRWVLGGSMLDSEYSLVKVERVEKHCMRFVAPDEIGALRKELARLWLAPLPKQFESLYEVCADRREEDGKVFLATANQRRGLWTRNLARAGFPLLALCADRLLSTHATSAASERNWSVWGQIYTKYKTRLGLIKACKIVYIRGNSTIVAGEDNEFEEVCLQFVD